MSNAAEMDAQEIINYIATAPKKTPVKLYVREKPGMKVAWGDAHVYGGRRGKTVFGDWDELKACLLYTSQVVRKRRGGKVVFFDIAIDVWRVEKLIE